MNEFFKCDENSCFCFHDVKHGLIVKAKRGALHAAPLCNELLQIELEDSSDVDVGVLGEVVDVTSTEVESVSETGTSFC